MMDGHQINIKQYFEDICDHIVYLNAMNILMLYN